VLLAGDIFVLLALREILHAVRDTVVIGARAAATLADIIPRGSFPPGQLVASVLLGLALLGNYGSGDKRRSARGIITGVMLGLGLIHWGAIWTALTPYVGVRFVIASFLIAPALIAMRFAVDWAVKVVRAEGSRVPRVLAIGPEKDLHRAMSIAPLDDPATFALVGAFATDDGNADVRGQMRALAAMLQSSRIDTVMLLGSLGDDVFAPVLEVVDAAGCQVFSVPRDSSLWGVESQLTWRGGVPLIQLTRPALRAQHLLVKRAFDVVAAGIGLVVLSPLYAAIAFAVRVTSRGPIFFRQERVGQGGVSFNIYKFRSMVMNAESQRGKLLPRSMYSDPRLFKIENDPRISRLGAFLRRTSLDELPQLWNVLCGTMSLVGPRPPVPSEVAFYEEHHYTRFELKPGITGPWQVNGRNRITDFEEVVRLETAYIRHWSFWHDLLIMFKTIPAVLRMRGAH
jgi:exopolysaccharide biosynthesis polyprenyl glycosylphosphotransferase